jgi:hypothetical protein
MKKPINEIERLKLIAGLINEINYNDSVYGVKRTTLTEGKKKKEVKELSIDVANPYEYRMGLQYELEQMDDYSNESLEKAKSIVLKNLAKDVNFYTTLLNQDQSPYKFEAPETDKPGMQAKADGYLKKELKKDAKANVQDTLGKKEAGKKKPKGVKVMPDKGVTGSEKTIKEGLEIKQDDDQIEISTDSGDYVGFVEANGKVSFEVYFEDIEAIEDEFGEEGITQNNWKEALGSDHAFVQIIDKIGGDVEAAGDYVMITVDADKLTNLKEGSFMGGVDLGASFDKMKGQMNAEDEFNSLMSKYDWYYEMSDDPRAYDRGTAMNSKLKMLGKQIGVDKAIELFNSKAPSDRKITSSFFMEGEDKHSKIKEALKAALKKTLKEEDPAMARIEKDEEAAEKALAQILTKKAAVLAKPGTQG